MSKNKVFEETISQEIYDELMDGVPEMTPRMFDDGDLAKIELILLHKQRAMRVAAEVYETKKRMEPWVILANGVLEFAANYLGNTDD